MMEIRRGEEGLPSRVRPIHLIATAAILGLLVMPVAFAHGGDPGAVKSAKLVKQIKSLKQRVAALEAKASQPPSGPAGDTCVQSVRIGQLCVRVENFARTFFEARGHCANLDLRLPSFSEATELVQTHDVPDVDENEFFWTDEFVQSDAVWVLNDGNGATTFSTSITTAETVCVTTPTT